MPKPKRTAIAVSPALVHENFLRAREAGLVMREADFRRRYHTLKHGLGAARARSRKAWRRWARTPPSLKLWRG